MNFHTVGKSLAILAIAGGTGLGLASTASAATYDGVAPQGSTCYASRALVRQTNIYYLGTRVGDIELWYSSSCRTTWARVLSVQPVQADRDYAGSAHVIRDTDGRQYSCNAPIGGTYCLTNMVNDANVTSHAKGEILYGGSVNSGVTTSY